jgi:NADH-quinone oxidoreductase subunit A
MVMQFYYIDLSFYIIFTIFLIAIILIVAFSLSKNALLLDFNKNSIYECGFETFSSSRTSFEIHFYLIGIIFIIFDLEIAFLFP